MFPAKPKILSVQNYMPSYIQQTTSRGATDLCVFHGDKIYLVVLFSKVKVQSDKHTHDDPGIQRHLLGKQE